ncbi:MAG: GTPase ObgE [Crocinitomicaceae bacterium]|nr:GTPase ObgE [Crocinitomicaceae bacterium]MBK8924784.1 GTPase ObgE [Crocinitomicaceae bacterium]
MSNFIDYVKILCRSGKGGPGSTYMYRAKGLPKGGPMGGDGGRGGHIILKGNKQMWTLLPLKYRKHVFAENGENGGHMNCTGADGKDMILEVPLGTVARNAETNEYMGEVSEDGQELILLKGGKGGKGNAFFKSSTNQAPRYAQPGIPEEEAWIILELKVLADVGLVGFPNAGKSTLLSVVSAAKPEIADYPFTTLTPNLGIVAYRDFKSFIMADIPGIIEGAHLGKGLGIRFLKHIERNSLLLFLIPADADSVFDQYHILLRELKEYNPELLDKPRVLAISKSDLIDDEIKVDIEKKLPGIPYVFISSATQQGLTGLKDIIWKELQKES